MHHSIWNRLSPLLFLAALTFFGSFPANQLLTTIHNTGFCAATEYYYDNCNYDDHKNWNCNGKGQDLTCCWIEISCNISIWVIVVTRTIVIATISISIIGVGAVIVIRAIIVVAWRIVIAVPLQCSMSLIFIHWTFLLLHRCIFTRTLAVAIWCGSNDLSIRRGRAAENTETRKKGKNENMWKGRSTAQRHFNL